VAALRRRAPGLDLRVRPLEPARLVSGIDAGAVDFGIGGHLDAPARISVTPLFEERFLCVTDPGNPATASGLTLAAYTALPHALFSASAERSGVVDEALGRIGLARCVAVTLPHVVAVPFAVRGSDLVATLAERIALRFAEAAGVAIHPLPSLALGTFSVSIASGWRVEADPLLVWVRELILACAASVPAAGSRDTGEGAAPSLALPRSRA
jgi:DNA-binding transcriptional LysR family regulator